MTELTDADKAVFKAATERRLANGIRLKRFSVMCDASQVSALNDLWTGWIERFGKQKAVDVLLRLMTTVETRMREADERRSSKT